ncbi:MAG: hypothetical protein PHE61_03275 [Candidatus Omnitrophica bacterium]|nr:hypothetical protein [Candidatus Omnitrophota bacterium]
MKKVLFLVVVAAMVLGISLCSFAQPPSCPMTGEKGRPGEGKGMKKGPDPMCSMMMECAMDKEMVATSDGGVVVMTGDKIMKYDKDLVLKKETRLNLDTEAAMKDAMEKCKKCRKMMCEEKAEETAPAAGMEE